MDTGTAAGKAFLDMLGVFAEFETNLHRERQLEGIKAAEDRGIYKSRNPRSLRLSCVGCATRRSSGLLPSHVALASARASIYCVPGAHEQAA